MRRGAVFAAIFLFSAAGCGLFRKAPTRPTLKDAIQATEAVAAAIDTSATEGIRHLERAIRTVDGAAGRVLDAAEEIRDLAPALEPQAQDLETQAETLRTEAVPEIVAAAASFAQIAAQGRGLKTHIVPDLRESEAQVSALAKERDAAVTRARKAEDDRDSAVRKVLLTIIGVSFLASVGFGVSIFVWQTGKMGIMGCIVSGITFGAASAAYRWLSEIQWAILIGGIGLATAGVVWVLVTQVFRRAATKTIVGGEKFKALLTEVASKVPDLARVKDLVLRLFGQAQDSAQGDDATRALVDKKQT